MEPEPRVVPGWHRTGLDRVHSVPERHAEAAPRREVHGPAAVLDVPGDPPRHWRDVLIPVRLGLVAMAVVAGGHRQPAGHGRVPGRLTALGGMRNPVREELD